MVVPRLAKDRRRAEILFNEIDPAICLLDSPS